ncbi:DDE-type integrase/transposase/recombinase [Phenylobacterium sp. 20VBR1]|uniref:DDE-type integrase/transposase/recombinase n=1 Tax=Phenylobacterium glaciei TaxID=2803784 RepID=A0A941CZG3_9CAUL|nr:DDE-type integrase/transposase/recombinase [Phenylobacterium glaciei]MBR7618689.1 DDE-type integrase/transposase/recombinase [Phenylobacterium glaciei]
MASGRETGNGPGSLVSYLWRAVDHEGEAPESFVTATRDKAAALKFIRKAMNRHGRPQALVTDGLRPSSAAMKEILIRRDLYRRRRSDMG